MWWSVALAAAPPPIVGGEQASPGAWPSAAALVARGGASCSGVLVHPRIVLSAAHCRDNEIEGVWLGAVDLNEETPGEWAEVASQHGYPDYAWTYDVLVLVLTEDAETSPAPLAIGCGAELLVDGVDAVLAGFGATDSWGSTYPDVLMVAETTVEVASCDDEARGCVPGAMPDGELIAGGDGIDSCYGDSGGPVYVATDWGEHLVAGVSSRAADPSDVPCGDGGIYVRVDAVRSWIEQTTGLTLDEPTCADPGVENEAPSPTAEPIEVESGARATVTVDPGDPDADDEHSFAVSIQPTYAEASIDAHGVLTVEADSDYYGPDALRVAVSDAWATGEVQVPITITLPERAPDTGFVFDDEPPGGCGCAGGAGGWWLLGLAAALLRRRGSMRPARGARGAC